VHSTLCKADQKILKRKNSVRWLLYQIWVRPKAALLGFVNYQKELPNVPVRDITVTLRLPGVSTPTACRRVSDGTPVEAKISAGALVLEVACLDTLEMIEVES